MKPELEVREKPTHEVMNHNDNGSIAFQGTGQKCADWMFEHKGNGYCMRLAIFKMAV